jgi:heme-degrading monooxygenase HmoA
MSTRYTYLWEFLIERTRREEFERHYGPNGTWVTLFRRSAGYRGTLLLRDRLDPLRFVTVDRWESEAAYRAFRAEHAAEYADLDARCEHLTLRETSLGEFEEAGE